MTVSFAALVDAANPLPNGTVIRSTATANGYVLGSSIYSGATASTDVVVSTADLSLGMVNASNPVAPGGTLSYTSTFGNAGGVSAPAAVLTVPLPPGTSFVSASDGGAVSGGIVSWNVGALPSGGTGQRTLTVSVDPLAVNGSIIAATANLSDAATGRSLARGNTAAAVLSNAFTQVAMTAAPDAVRPGQLVQYAVTVTNRDSVARYYTITAQVPNGTTVAGSAISQIPGSGSTCGAATCVAGAAILWGGPGYSAVPLTPGQSVTVSFAALVDAANPLPNGTVIRSTATASATGTGASAAVDVVVSTADLSLGMVNASSPVAPGGVLS